MESLEYRMEKALVNLAQEENELAAFSEGCNRAVTQENLATYEAQVAGFVCNPTRESAAITKLQEASMERKSMAEAVKTARKEFKKAEKDFNDACEAFCYGRSKNRESVKA